MLNPLENIALMEKINKKDIAIIFKANYDWTHEAK